MEIVACEKYEEYVKDYDYSAVYFGTQRQLRTLVTRTDRDSLEFKIGVALGGVRESKGYAVEFMVDTNLLNTVDGADIFTLLPDDCYSIENANHTFVIPAGKFLGDCPVKIDKEKFVNLHPASLENTYALPLRLLSTDADSILSGRDYAIIVIKYIDEHSGAYYTKGWQAQWDGTAIVPETTEEYANIDLSKNKIRLLTTRSLTQFDMAGMGNLDNSNSTVAAADHLLVNLVAGVVTLATNPGSNAVADRGSTYNADTKTFTFDYLYTKDGTSYLVNEVLVLRQDVEKELRFETW
ncbi:MAG: DUF1735 domain-containing protein [Bacteroidales bacterium]|jgi:hypothetical protein|nr:DUF1735 domain-containing protein [Bacteroidales bacterium]